MACCACPICFCFPCELEGLVQSRRLIETVWSHTRERERGRDKPKQYMIKDTPAICQHFLTARKFPMDVAVDGQHGKLQLGQLDTKIQDVMQCPIPINTCCSLLCSTQNSPMPTWVACSDILSLELSSMVPWVMERVFWLRYWTDAGSFEVTRSNLDGTDVEVIQNKSVWSSWWTMERATKRHGSN